LAGYGPGAFLFGDVMTWETLPIPDDWSEQTDGYRLIIACVPNSKLWLGIYQGIFYELTRGRRWDGSTGAIIGAQNVAKFVHEGLMACQLDDLVTAMADLNSTLQTIAQNTTNLAGLNEALVTAMATLSIDVNIAQDDALVTKLEELSTMLETKLTAETTAANTRKDELESVLDAIENVLGGSFVPQ
jgi:hypothetical protein